MNEQTTQGGRLLMAIVSFTVGTILLLVVPIFAMQAMDTIFHGLDWRYELMGEPTILSAMGLVKLFYSLLIGLTIAAGGLLIFFSIPLYKDISWIRPIALLVAAFPCIAGAYLFGPVMLFASEHLLTTTVLVTFLGLAAYFVILLSDKATKKEKIFSAIIFLLIGVEIAYAMVNGISTTRMATGWGAKPRTLELFFYLYGVPVIWLGCILALVGIPFYAARRDVGWWLAVSGSILMLIGTVLFLIAKATGWFIVGLFLCITCLVVLLIPVVGGHPLNRHNGSIVTPICRKE